MCLSDFILHLPPSGPFIYFPSIDENVIIRDPFIVVFFFFFKFCFLTYIENTESQGLGFIPHYSLAA